MVLRAVAPIDRVVTVVMDARSGVDGKAAHAVFPVGDSRSDLFFEVG